VEFPYPLLVCDVGGTNVRMGFCGHSGSEPRPLTPRLTATFPDFGTCLEDALEEIGEHPRSVIACAAGPAVGRHINLTNGAWTIDGPQLAYQLDLSQGLLLNDFEAQALSLPICRPEWLRNIGRAQAVGSGPRLILGPGTGLGVAALLEHGTKYLPIASEAAHTGFAATDDAERDVWALVERSHGRITAETLVSGPGLVRLHNGRAGVFGFASDLADAPSIIEAASRNPSGQAADTVRHFWRLVARLSGDLALMFLARGGVTLSGGVLPRITEFLDADVFRAEFEAKAPMTELVRRIPTHLLEMKSSVLFGMAAIAKQPANYLIDYGARAWR
jgi:glucokinase